MYNHIMKYRVGILYPIPMCGVSHLYIQAMLQHKLRAPRLNSMLTLSPGDSIRSYRSRLQSYKTATRSSDTHSKSRLSPVQQSSFIHSSAFRSFSYPRSTLVQKFYIENYRNKQFIHFNLYAVLSSMMESCTTQPGE